MRSFLPLSALVLALLVGCRGSDDCDDEAACAPPAGAAGVAAAPGVSIAEALASETSEQLLVSGNLLAQGDEVQLCSALAESFPPQCGGASLDVEGLKLEEVDGLVTEGDVSWTDRPIELLGLVEDGALKVSQNATS